MYFRSLPKIIWCIQQSKVSPWSPAEDPFVLWSMKTDSVLQHFRIYLLTAMQDNQFSLEQAESVTRNNTSDAAQGSAWLVNLTREHIAVDWG